MIKSIRIENFQSHKETKLDFHPGVNIILGSSDSGKTAIIRAIRWLVFNRPSGDEFRSYWGGDTKVKINLFSGDNVERVRSNKENKYVVNDSSLKALKTDVPEDVSMLLNLSLINIQQQMDSSFLLSETSGVAANFFSQIVHLEKINETIKKLNSEHYKVKQNLNFEKQRLVEYREKRKEFIFLDDLDFDLKKVEAKFADLSVLKEKVNKLYTLIEKLRQNALKLGFLGGLDDLKEAYSNLSFDWEKYVNYESKKDRLRNLVVLINAIDSDIKNAKNVLKLKSDFMRLQELRTRLDANSRNEQKLSILIKKLVYITDNKKKIFTQLNDDKKRFDELMPDVCPLCGCQISKCNH